jgi:hypothetical protein
VPLSGGSFRHSTIPPEGGTTKLLSLYTPIHYLNISLSKPVHSGMQEENIMPRAKESSTILDKATVRLEGIRAIDAAMDLGSGVSVAALDAALVRGRTKMNEMIQQVSILEEKQAELRDAEKAVAELYTRFLAGIASKYGKDSIEYAQAGGTRSRDRKRPTPKPRTSPKILS